MITRTEWELPAGSLVTTSWLGLSCGQRSVRHSLKSHWTGSTDLGRLRWTITWITGFLMYHGLLVRISMGGLLKHVLGSHWALLLGTCPNTAHAACSSCNWLGNGCYSLGLACRIMGQNLRIVSVERDLWGHLVQPRGPVAQRCISTALQMCRSSLLCDINHHTICRSEGWHAT